MDVIEVTGYTCVCDRSYRLHLVDVIEVTCYTW